MTKSLFKKFFKYSFRIDEDWMWFSQFKDRLKEDNLLCFMAQVAHESVYLRHREELWSYSKSALLRVFPKYFNQKNVDKYARSPKALARAYANRMGNGNEKSFEGFKYRGRGYIQLTGKNNYRLYGYLKNPHALLETEHAWKVAFQFWLRNKLDGINDIKKQTRIINGGYNGLKDRISKHKKLLNMV